MSSNSSCMSSSEGTSPESGWNGDGVVPTKDELSTTLSHSHLEWTRLLSRARESHLHPGAVLPKRLLNNIPKLPSRLKGMHSIAGKATWHLRSSGCDGPATRTGSERQWRLSPRGGLPTFWSLSNETSFTYVQNPTNALAPLFLAWAYILSKSLLERQGIPTVYTPPQQAPPGGNKDQRHEEMYISIGRASAAERRWWSALVAPGHGWRSSGQNPPWVLAYTGNIRLYIEADDMGSDNGRSDPELETMSPPSSAEAMVYLMRFSSVYDLDDQAMLALAMALTIPLHNETRSAVTLPKPCGLTVALSRQKRADVHTPCIDDQCRNLGYFMTLSSNPRFLSSALWGIFWEPGVDCNHVSAWLKPIHETVEPLVQAGDLERLAHLFALRCPVVSPLWYGVLACGQTKTFHAILRFLATLQSPSVYWPVPEVAVWTRSPQSFMDFCGTGPYLAFDSGTHWVKRADVWRLRHEFCGMEPSDMPFRNTPLCPWPPFGTMRDDEIEPPVRKHLRCNRHEWEYTSWTWVIGGNEQYAGRGFVVEEDEGCSGRDDMRDRRPVTQGQAVNCRHVQRLDQTASRQAVSDIFRWAATEMEVSGDCIYRHPWVCAHLDLSMGGNDELETSSSSTKPKTDEKRFVEEWLAGQNHHRRRRHHHHPNGGLRLVL